MEQFIPLVIGALLPPIVSRVSSSLKVSHSTALIILAACIGVLYTAYTFYVPGATQDHIASFALSAVGTAVLVYEKFLRNK